MTAKNKKLEREAQAVIEATLKAMPRPLQKQIAHIPVVLENAPNRDLQNEAVESDTLGLFIGEALPDSSFGSQQLPAQIILFIDNIWDYAEQNLVAYRREVRCTLLHELGHYLGLDEDDLCDRDLD